METLDPVPPSPRVNPPKINFRKLWRYALPFICLVLGVWLVWRPPARIDRLDAVADQYFEDSVTKASVAYGTSRLINAGVSVVKDSSVQLQPAGLGISLAVGQVLDPLDDLNERLSSVLVTAIISLLAQKICYEIAQEFVLGFVGVIPPARVASLVYSGQCFCILPESVIESGAVSRSGESFLADIGPDLQPTE
jgi:hypothetical protein